MDTTAHQKFTKARAGLVLDQPFFASIALRLRMMEDATAPTMYTDGEVLGYNPAFVNTLTLDELKGVICHEVMHVAMLHNLRKGEREHETWNIAADLAINSIIEDAGMVLPKSRLREPQFDGMSAEAIYPRIYNPNKPPGADPGGTGEVRDFPSPSGKGKATPQEVAQQTEQQKIDTQNALTSAKRAGSLPGSLERLINDLLEPVIPWREVLARFIDTASRNDYTWTQRNRRYPNVYLPALQSPELGTILIAVDTSGSIDQQQLQLFISEIKGIMTAYQGAQATVIFCDYDIQGEPFTLEAQGDENLLKPQGGGGTSFKPPFRWAEEKGLTPKALIYFTDGYCHDFPVMPDYETLWLLTDRNPNFHPPFGETIEMRD